MFGFLGGPCGCWSATSRSVYRSHFCGLCNRLRADYGPAARFLVNRDATVLSLLVSARMRQAALPTRTTCCNPLGKARPVIQEGPGAVYAAAVTVLGLQAKLEDEADDAASRWRALGARGSLRLLRRRTTGAMRTLRNTGFPVDRVQSALRRQAKVEEAARRTAHGCLERAARPSEVALGTIFAHAGDAYSKAWASIGRSLGRLIYTLDAVEDLARDARTGAFNPLRLEPALVDAIPTRVESDLAAIRSSAASAPLRRHRNLIESILGPLLSQRTAAVLSRQGLAVPASMEPDRPTRKSHRSKRARSRDGCCGVEDGTWCFCCDCTPCCEACSVGDACCCACPCP